MGKISKLKQKHNILKKNLQKGRHMSPLSVKDMEEHECLNCHTTYRGYFCPRCGQSAGTTRLTIKEGLSTVMGGILKFNKGMSHTLLELIYRPGYLAYDYIKGYRKEYYPPITLLFILVAVPLMLNTFLPPSASSTQAMVAVIGEEFVKRGMPIEPLEFLQHLLATGSLRILIEALLTIPALWLSFHWTEVGKRTNWAETFYLSVFIACNELLIGLLFYPLEFLTYKVSGLTMSGWMLGGPETLGGLRIQSYISGYVAMVVQIWMLRSFYKTSWCSTILRYILYYLLVMVTFSVVAILLVIGILSYISILR